MSAAPVQDSSESAVLTDRERWYAAISYFFFLCFLGLWKGKESDFVRFHARQGFLLFVAECVCLAAVIVIDQTVGRLPFLGLLVVIVLQIIVYLGALFLSVVGFVKAFFGERWRMPLLGKVHRPRSGRIVSNRVVSNLTGRADPGPERRGTVYRLRRAAVDRPHKCRIRYIMLTRRPRTATLQKPAPNSQGFFARTASRGLTEKGTRRNTSPSLFLQSAYTTTRRAGAGLLNAPAGPRQTIRLTSLFFTTTTLRGGFPPRIS